MAHRLFVGLDLPRAARDALAALQGGLEGARWLPPENFHITLRFIGEVDRRQANDIADELAAARAAPFEARLAGAGLFRTGRRARALWAGVAPAPELLDAKRQADAACARAGLGPPERRFTPHVTLARLSRAAPEAAERRAAELAGAVAGAFPVEEIVLFESHLGAEGARYERAARFPLSPA